MSGRGPARVQSSMVSSSPASSNRGAAQRTREHSERDLELKGRVL